MGENWRLLGRLHQLAWPIGLIFPRVSYVGSLVDFVVVNFGCNQSYSICTKNRRKIIQTTLASYYSFTRVS